MLPLDGPAVNVPDAFTLAEAVACPGRTPWQQLEEQSLQQVVDRLEAEAGDELALIELVGEGYLAGEVLGTSGSRGQQVLRESKARLRGVAGVEGLLLLRAAG